MDFFLTYILTWWLTECMWTHILAKYIQKTSGPRAEPWGTFWIMEAWKDLQRWLYINSNYNVTFALFYILDMLVSQELAERWVSKTKLPSLIVLKTTLMKRWSMKMSPWHSRGRKHKIVCQLRVLRQVTSWPMDILLDPNGWINRKGCPSVMITQYCASSPG